MKTYTTIVKEAKDYDELSKHAAEHVINVVNKKPEATICIAGGDTPKGMINNLVQAKKEGAVDFSQCQFIGLDEWVGLGENDPGSCQHFLYHHLFKPLEIEREQIHVFDARSEELNEECTKMNQLLDSLGGLDIVVLGIGVNGHVGFNEPETGADWKAHVIRLDEKTLQVGQKYFDSSITPPKFGITLGMKQLLHSKEVVVIASGEKKLSAVQQLLYGEVSMEHPASILRYHPSLRVLVDQHSFVKTL
ncbi:6-phosphogluconolactonase [Salibacterium aidingense]|uniref:6-phosphogluconolactonase n=1 Tax=Salibacterium aidingense TaxID=384933 RepID=UPI003BE873E7